MRSTGVLHQPGGDRHGEQRHGYGRQIDPAPVRVVEDHAREERAHGQRRHQGRRPQAHELAALARVGHRLADHRQRRRQQASGADPGQRLTGPQHLDRLRAQCRRGPGGGEREARLEHLLAPVHVAEHAGCQDERRHRQDERVGHPGQLGCGRVQRALDRRETHRHGGHRQIGDEHPDTGHDEGDGPPLPCSVRRCRLVHEDPLLRRRAPRSTFRPGAASVLGRHRGQPASPNPGKPILGCPDSRISDKRAGMRVPLFPLSKDANGPRRIAGYAVRVSPQPRTGPPTRARPRP